MLTSSDRRLFFSSGEHRGLYPTDATIPRDVLLYSVISRTASHRPLSRRLDRCDQFGNVERNSHCDVLHFTPVRVARLFLDCNGVFAIKAYSSGF